MCTRRVFDGRTASDPGCIADMNIFSNAHIPHYADTEAMADQQVTA